MKPTRRIGTWLLVGAVTLAICTEPGLTASLAGKICSHAWYGVENSWSFLSDLSQNHGPDRVNPTPTTPPQATPRR